MRLIDADALIQEAERLYGEWNKAMAGAEGARQINKVYKMQELSEAVAEVARHVPTYAPHPYEMRWIPCADRLPDNEDKGLCCTQTKTGSKNIVLGYYADGWRCGMNSNVIAWMPLPDVPDDFANADKKLRRIDT